MNKEEILNVSVCCGGRSSQQTYNNFVKMYSYAKENGFKGINITFIDPELDKLQQKLNQLETICNNLMNYLDKNKLVLQNPNILDFYREMKELGSGSNE